MLEVVQQDCKLFIEPPMQDLRGQYRMVQSLKVDLVMASCLITVVAMQSVAACSGEHQILAGLGRIIPAQVPKFGMKSLR